VPRLDPGTRPAAACHRHRRPAEQGTGRPQATRQLLRRRVRQSVTARAVSAASQKRHLGLRRMSAQRRTHIRRLPMILFGLNADEVSTDYPKGIVVTVLVAATTSAATFLFTWWWARRRAYRQWHAKEFLDRIIVSLNIFADGFLKIRTVMEKSLDEIFLNKVA